MTTVNHVPQVGIPDPELNTSPIVEREDAEEPTLEWAFEHGACYFNSVRYPIGQYVRSGDELLHCEERGIWVRKAEMEY